MITFLHLIDILKYRFIYYTYYSFTKQLRLSDLLISELQIATLLEVRLRLYLFLCSFIM